MQDWKDEHWPPPSHTPGEPCVFCEIVAGTRTCHKVHEDELTLTFMDIFPVSTGHTLIIPKRHFTNLFEMEPAVIGPLAMHSVRMANAIRRALVPEGIGVHQLNGRAAGQTVFHYHMHLIPRTHGEHVHLSPRVRAAPPALEAVAERLRAALG
ncbi:MAG: HIT family protein [Gammaproteobacteria bacterium]